MEIEKLTQVYRVEKNGAVYTRFWPNDWMQFTGCSEEPVFDCKELEKEFQEKLKEEKECCRNCKFALEVPAHRKVLSPIDALACGRFPPTYPSKNPFVKPDHYCGEFKRKE